MHPTLTALPGHGHQLQADVGPAPFTLIAAHVSTPTGPTLLVLSGEERGLGTLLNVDDVDVHLLCTGRTWVQLLDRTHHDAGLASVGGNLRLCLWRAARHVDGPHHPDALRDLLRAAAAQAPQALAEALRGLGATSAGLTSSELTRVSRRRADFWAN